MSKSKTLKSIVLSAVAATGIAVGSLLYCFTGHNQHNYDNKPIPTRSISSPATSLPVTSTPTSQQTPHSPQHNQYNPPKSLESSIQDTKITQEPKQTQETREDKELADRKARYRTPEQLASIFRRYGVEPIVQDNKGDRNLIILGQDPTIPNLKRITPPFFGKLVDILKKEQVLKQDEKLTLFMEGVYAEVEEGKDPYIENYNARSLIFYDFEADPEKLKELDPEAYFALSANPNLRIQGLEDRQLTRDTCRLQCIYDKLPELFDSIYKKGERDEKLEARIKELASQLEGVSLKVPRCGDEFGEQESKLFRDSSRLYGKIGNTDRYRQFAQVLRQNLVQDRTAGLLLSQDHIFPVKETERFGNLPENLKGIGWIYLDLDDAIRIGEK